MMLPDISQMHGPQPTRLFASLVGRMRQITTAEVHSDEGREFWRRKTELLASFGREGIGDDRISLHWHANGTESHAQRSGNLENAG
jgi:hypothetical protein